MTFFIYVTVPIAEMLYIYEAVAVPVSDSGCQPYIDRSVQLAWSQDSRFIQHCIWTRIWNLWHRIWATIVSGVGWFKETNLVQLLQMSNLNWWIKRWVDTSSIQVMLRMKQLLQITMELAEIFWMLCIPSTFCQISCWVRIWSSRLVRDQMFYK